MASTSHNPTPSSSASSSLPTKWDVFLSFRGKDTGYTFTDHLYHSLQRNGIQTFRDSLYLRGGEVISSALLQAIQDSKIFIVVLSKNYASSQYCLDELAEILKCHQSKSMHRVVIPVFYYIDPSEDQTERFDKAFRKHKNRVDGDRLKKWRDNLKEVWEFSGYHVPKDMSQVDVINEIIDRVLREVNPVSLNVAKYKVGLDSRVKDIATLLSNVTAPVIRIGIYGTGGVGKTTLAKAMYNQNCRHFEGSCFLENVREASQTDKGIAGLQQKLVNDVLKCKSIIIDNPDCGIELIRARICTKKILVVIDNLDKKEPLEFLEGPFALGSIILITTRDKGLLKAIDVEAKYKVNELGDVESRQLFCQHAFGGDTRIPDTFSELSKEILKHAGGLPLALKVCGSALLKESEEEWRYFIGKLRQVSIADVDEILLISFDALDDPMLKDIFLDIACFFIGREEEDVIKILETCYTSVNHYIDILKKKGLLTINHEGFLMHDLVLDMARKIACNNSPDAFGNHSRLWVSEIIHEVLKENKGTEAIEGIIPSNFSLFNFDPYSEDSLEHNGRKSITASKSNEYVAETFERMSKLRFLYLQKVRVTGSFEHIFKELRWLYWESCPLWYLPCYFCPQKLVFLALHGSKIRTMWAFNDNTVGIGSQVFKNLKTLYMPHSHDLITISDFTRLPCLETLNLKGCERLEEVHESIGSLVGLVSLNLGFCTSLKTPPDSICNLKALKSLFIQGCCNLEAIPMNFGNIDSLVELDARWLNLCELPDSIGHLSKLVVLNLSACEKLKTLPNNICDLSSLKMLNIELCSSLEALPTDLGNLKSLVELRAAAGSLVVSELPNSIGCLSKLVSLNLSHFGKLKNLPVTICNLRSLEILNIDGWSSLEALPTELGNLESLVELRAASLVVSELPHSIGRLSKLVILSLSHCRKLKTLQNCNMRSLEILDIDWCSNLEALPSELGSSLKMLSLEGCESVKRLPNLSNLKQLEELNLRGCYGLEEIQGLEELTSIQTLHLGGCMSSLLKSTFTKRLFQIYSGFGHRIKIFAPSLVFPDWISQSPDWISETSNFVSTVSLDLPANMSQNFLAMIVCLKFSKEGTAVASVKTTTNNSEWKFLYKASYYEDYKDFSCMDIIPRTIFPVTDDDGRIEFTAGLECSYSTFIIKKAEEAEIIGIHLLYRPEINMIDECVSDEETFFDTVETFGK